MPYKSDQQRKYFHYAESKGLIKPSAVKEFDEASKGMKLPNKVEPTSKNRFSKLHKHMNKQSGGYV